MTEKVVYFDLEGARADRVFSWTNPSGERHTAFVRLCGALRDDSDAVGITTDPQQLIRLLMSADRIEGHNILGFDLIALAVHEGADYDALARKSVDTLYRARVQDPPGARGQKPWTVPGYYGLDQLAQRLGHDGKTADLKALAREFGDPALTPAERAKDGYGKIPLDDGRYRAYLTGDLHAQRSVSRSLGDLSAYERREMTVGWLQNRMTLSGWRVDETLLAQKVKAEQERKEASAEWLEDRYGLPLGREVHRGRGKARKAVWEPHSAPLATKEGAAWLADIWEGFGVHSPPLTPKKHLSTKADALKEVAAFPECPAELKEVISRIGDVTGANAKFAEITKYVINGRIHPEVGEVQSSSRWAYVRASVTNMGKRGGKVADRAVLVSDGPGWVLIAFDLAQVDMRAIAGHSQDPAYMEVFGPGRDAHSEIAALVGLEREQAKPIGHGWNYGMGINGQVRGGVPRELAVQFDQRMTEMFPVLCAWRDGVRERGAAGELLDNGFGRLMRCDPDRAHTQAPALMGQGGARDIICEGLIRLARDFPEAVPWLRVVVHDEIVLCVPQKRLPEVTERVTDALQLPGGFKGVPIFTDGSKPGEDWASCYAK